MGRTIFAILAGMAENERFAIRDRTAGGRAEKAAKGGFAGGPAPYGYERDGQGGLIVVPHEAAIVRRMFALKRNGLTFRSEGRQGRLCGRACALRVRTRRAGRLDRRPARSCDCPAHVRPETERPDVPIGRPPRAALRAGLRLTGTNATGRAA